MFFIHQEIDVSLSVRSLINDCDYILYETTKATFTVYLLLRYMQFLVLFRKLATFAH